jgi:SpoIID/LytB domain protein
LEYIKENGPVSCPENQRGHGVGVSAWGMKEMALNGVNYRDIINYYLTGVEFEKMY